MLAELQLTRIVTLSLIDRLSHSDRLVITVSKDRLEANLAKHTLTTGEIAQYCDVNSRTVIRWIKRGHLRAYQLPGRGDNRIALEDFLAFLAAHGMPVPRELSGPSARVGGRTVRAGEVHGSRANRR